MAVKPRMSEKKIVMSLRCGEKSISLRAMAFATFLLVNLEKVFKKPISFLVAWFKMPISSLRVVLSFERIAGAKFPFWISSAESVRRRRWREIARRANRRMTIMERKNTTRVR